MKANSSLRFWAIVRYEILWNIRKKKVLGMVLFALVFSIIPLALAPALISIVGQTLTKNPDYVATSGGISGLIMFLFGLVAVMNSISGEFESGTIVPLLTKPVSRTMVFLGKVSAAILTLIPVYILLYVIQIVGGIIVYGPQNNLYLASLSFLGNIISTLVWIAVVLAIGSVTKSSLFAALGPFVIYIALSISAGIIAVYSGQAWILTYIPGGGNTGYVVSTANAYVSLSTTSVSTGTDGIAAALVSYVLHPSYYVLFAKISGISSSVTSSTLTVISTEPLLEVLLTAIGVAFAYIIAFLLIA
ncbi:MAG: ABC transporter permease [Nitrososphaeria archaeon]|jgi:ABC-2 type transport system permease protein